MTDSLRLKDLVSQHGDSVKGALILTVVADHNDWLRDLSPQLFNPLTFHVLGFFLLTFTFGTKVWTPGFIADRAARYLVPFWWALLGFTVAYLVMYRAGAETWLDGILRFALALVIGNAPYVKASSGLLMLWFLPALFGLTCMLAFFDSIISTKIKCAAVVLLVVVHFVIPFLPRIPLLALPFGLVIATDVFILGLIWRRLILLRASAFVGPLASIIFFICYGTLVFWNNHLEIGTLVISEMQNPIVLVLSDVSSLAAIPALVWLCEWFRPIRWLAGIGRNSLLVYLFHPICYVVLTRVWPSPSNAGQSTGALLFSGLLTTMVALVVAYAMALIVSRSTLMSDWVVPRSWDEWGPVRKLRGQARAM